jgi:hypothetical protein
MMSYTTSAVWSRPVLSLCCTEHGQRRGVVLSGHITTVAMSRSGQLGRYCTIEPHYSGLHICRRFSNARACLGQLSLSLIMWSTAHGGPWDMWQHWSSSLRKAEPRAVGHVAAPELPFQEARA